MRVFEDKSLTPGLHLLPALCAYGVEHVGEGDRYLDMLEAWRECSHAADDLGRARPTRRAPIATPGVRVRTSSSSDTVLGIDTAGPGFKRVPIRPFLGKLTHASGSIRHPKGEVAIDLRANGSKLVADVSLPPGTPGEFVWKDIRKPLTPGKNHVEF